jgi:hypothetical protein
MPIRAVLTLLLLETSAPPAQDLRDTGLYAEATSDRIAARNLRFSPQYPLWSDGAAKRRWVFIPPGTTIDASGGAAGGGWNFPVGTKLWKEFRFAGRRVETRLIERLSDGSWRYAAYVWNQRGDRARLVPAAGVAEAFEIAPGIHHTIPSHNDCRACHEGQRVPVLGFSALQLSPARDRHAPHAEPQPPGAVDLPALVRRGLLVGLDSRLLAHPPRIAAGGATARAALGYLHGNCGHCHNAGGPLALLALPLDQTDADRRAVAALLGATVGRASQFRPRGAAHTLDRIAAGRPEASALLVRMRSRLAAEQMPPLGTGMVDAAAMAVIERWISEL